MKIAVGLSGGVDSAVAALLLKRAGHDVTGVTMKLWREGRYKGGCRDACFGPSESKDIALAGAFAKMAGIEHNVIDCADEYERVVIEYFRREKAAGRTPNPCVVCNALVKFGVLVETATQSFGFDRFATGHYARIVSHGGRLAVAQACDCTKAIDRDRIEVMLNTSGARNADEAVRIARIGRTAGFNWLKIEIHPDARYLLPDPVETLAAVLHDCLDARVAGLPRQDRPHRGGQHERGLARHAGRLRLGAQDRDRPVHTCRRPLPGRGVRRHPRKRTGGGFQETWDNRI